MSRETTVVDPGGGTRGSGPPPPPMRPDVCSKIFIVFWCPPMICSPLLAKSISHANGDRCSQTVLSEPRPTNQKFLDPPLD